MISGGADRDADRRGSKELVPFDIEGLLECAPQPLRHADRIADLGNIVNQHRELVAGDSPA